MFEPTITKDNLPLSFGSFKPTGHVVIVFPEESAADTVAQSLQSQGVADGDIVRLSPEEVVAQFKPLLPDASGASGFGSEIQSMRQMYLLALEGHGLMIVRVRNDEMQNRVAEAARSGKATLAKKYGMLTIEELI